MNLVLYFMYGLKQELRNGNTLAISVHTCYGSNHRGIMLSLSGCLAHPALFHDISEEVTAVDISSAAQAQSATGNTTILKHHLLVLRWSSSIGDRNASILSVVSLSSEIQAQSAVGNANIDSGINTLSSDAQAQSASGDATVLCFVTMASEAQAHAAIGAAFISAFISVSSSVQAQRAAASANMLIDGTVSLSSNVQAQSSIAGGSYDGYFDFR